MQAGSTVNKEQDLHEARFTGDMAVKEAQL